MIFRLRRYQVASGKLEAFNEFFLDYLLPVQQRHGARLVGRWALEDGSQVLAIWVYESRERYEEIQQRVASDPDATAAQEHRRATLDPLVTETEEEFMFSTVPFSVTELAHLDERDVAGSCPEKNVVGFVKRYLITGSAGAGKSTLAEKLTASGYQAIEADTDLAVYIDATTEEIVDAGDLGPDEHWELGHLWAWDPAELKRLLDDQTHPMLFICGAAAHQERYYGLFDKVFVLHVKSDEELSRRLRHRWPQCDQTQINVDVAQNAGMPVHAARHGLDLIDASEPIDEVLRRILQQCAAAPVGNA